MPVPNRYILHQAPVIAALGQSVVNALVRRATGTAGSEASQPSPWIETTLSPRAPDLVKQYVRHVGGEASAYKRAVPAHLFPQWGFPLATKLLSGVDYPLQKVLNAGCRLEVKAPLPQGEALNVRARLESIDDNGRRALLHTRVITGTKSAPDAVIGDMYALVPLGGGKDKSNGTSKGSDNGAAANRPKKKEHPRVPSDAREVSFWKLSASAGLEFAKLTGDFNPVHWVPAYARAFGFRNCILHGFSTMARTMEGLNRNVFSGDTTRLRVLDVKFTSPLLLPARVGLYLTRDDEVFVGDAPGGRAYLTGTFERAASTS